MADFQGTLLFDSAINLQGLTQSAQRAKAVLDRLGTDAAKTFQNDIGRALGNAVRPENFAADVAKSKALLKSIGVETSKSFETSLGRKQAKALLQPFVDETTTFAGIVKKNLAGAFSIKNFALGIGGGLGLASLGTSLLQLGKDSIAFSAQFETALAKVQTIADKGIDMGRVRESIKTLASEVPQDIVGLGEGLFDIIGSGIKDTADALKVLEISAKAAVAGVSTTAEASRAIVFILNGFQKSVKETQHISDILFKTVDEGVISFTQLASVVGDIAAPAKAAGVSLEDVSAAIAAMTKGGISAELTVTSLRNLIGDIISPSKAAAEAARKLGLDFSKAGIEAAGGFAPFIKQIQELSAGDPNTLRKLFPDERSTRAVLQIAGSMSDEFQRLAKQFNNLTEVSGATEKAFQTMNATAENQYKLFKNNLSNAVETLGKGLLENLKPALEITNKAFSDTSNQSVNNIKKIVEAIGILAKVTNSLGQLGLSARIFSTLFPSKVEDTSGKFILPADERTNAFKKNAETIKQAIAEIEAKMQPVSDDVQTLSSAAEDTAKGFERSAKAFQELEKLASKIKSTPIVDEFFNNRGSIINEFDKGQLGKIKLIVDLPETDTAKKLKFVAEALEADTKAAEIAQKKLNELADDLTVLSIAFGKALGDDFGNILDSIVGFAKSVSDGNVVGAVSSALQGLESLINVIIPSGAAARAREIARLDEEIRNAQELEAASLRNAQDATARRLTFTSERLSAAFERLANSIGANEASVKDLLDTLASGNEKLKGFSFSASNDQLLNFFRTIQNSLGRLPKNIQEIFDSFSPLTRFTPEIREFLDRLKALSPTLQQQVIDLINSLLLAGDGIKNFGKSAASAFNNLIDELNLRFDLLNIDDPLKKLDLLAKGIRDKFKAIVPTTDAGIRDLIAKGLEALEAGGQTLVNFLKALDLEELTADQFRDFLQLLNQLANEAKSKVEDIGKATDEEITIAAVRQITYTQGNKLIDELTTMRIIQTQMLDIMRSASLRAPNFRNFGIPGNRIVVVNNTGVTEGSEADLRGLNRRQLELAMAASRAQGVN